MRNAPAGIRVVFRIRHVPDAGFAGRCRGRQDGDVVQRCRADQVDPVRADRVDAPAGERARSRSFTVNQMRSPAALIARTSGSSSVCSMQRNAAERADDLMPIVRHGLVEHPARQRRRRRACLLQCVERERRQERRNRGITPGRAAATRCPVSPAPRARLDLDIRGQPWARQRAAAASSVGIRSLRARVTPRARIERGQRVITHAAAAA